MSGKRFAATSRSLLHAHLVLVGCGMSIIGWFQLGNWEFLLFYGVITQTCPLQSVINRPLLERLDLLKATIAAPPAEGILIGKGTVRASLAKLIPNEVVLDHTVCSKICHSMEDIQAAFDEAIRVQVCMLHHMRFSSAPLL